MSVEGGENGRFFDDKPCRVNGRSRNSEASDGLAASVVSKAGTDTAEETTFFSPSLPASSSLCPFTRGRFIPWLSRVSIPVYDGLPSSAEGVLLRDCFPMLRVLVSASSGGPCVGVGRACIKSRGTSVSASGSTNRCRRYRIFHFCDSTG